MITAYRITKRRFQESAFTGEGARLGGGRFNSVGVPAVYVASSLPLALLEVLTGLNRHRRLDPYVYFEVRFKEQHVMDLDLKQLPANWADAPAPKTVRALGDAWLRAGRSLALRVPSAVLPQERNYVLNPAHEAAAALAVAGPKPVTIDPRLLEGPVPGS